VILVVSVVLWFLASYGPKADESFSIQESENLVESYAGHFGKAIEPAIQPIGFNWKIGISLITSFAAREVFVGSMATIYAVGDDSETSRTLLDKMRDAKREDGTPVYTLATGVSLMIFYVFAMQCMATLAVVKRETKSWKWPLIQMGYMGVLAYLGAFVTYLILA
jgi:ferrous iron transport protein B